MTIKLFLDGQLIEFQNTKLTTSFGADRLGREYGAPSLGFCLDGESDTAIPGTHLPERILVLSPRGKMSGGGRVDISRFGDNFRVIGKISKDINVEVF